MHYIQEKVQNDLKRLSAKNRHHFEYFLFSRVIWTRHVAQLSQWNTNTRDDEHNEINTSMHADLTMEKTSSSSCNFKIMVLPIILHFV